MIEKYNTYEVYKCEDCGAYIKMAPHNEEVLPNGHRWKRWISKEKQEAIVTDPLKEAVV
jgi:hypothetical protein